jgi:hypothetical protein
VRPQRQLAYGSKFFAISYVGPRTIKLPTKSLTAKVKLDEGKLQTSPDREHIPLVAFFCRHGSEERFVKCMALRITSNYTELADTSYSTALADTSNFTS